MTTSFALSDAALLATQATLVAAPRPHGFAFLDRLAGPLWALVPVLSIVSVVFGISAFPGSASTLAYLALVAVPPLAAVAIGYTVRGGVPQLAPLAAVLFVTAWVDRSGLVGQAAGVALSALACVTLASALAAVAPIGWLKAGVVAMAIADATLVIAEQLQGPNASLNVAAPAAGLPQLQRALFGSAVLGFGDLFLAAVLGAIVAKEGWPAARAALLTLGLALTFALLFFFVDELPATVPIALALLVMQLLWSSDRCKTLPQAKPSSVGADSYTHRRNSA